MKLHNTRKTATTVAVSALLAAVALAGCSSDSGSSSSDASKGTTDRGPITFAMGKNDTDKLKPVIEKWNTAHPDEQVTLKELAGEADAQRETLVQALQAKSTDYDGYYDAPAPRSAPPAA